MVGIIILNYNTYEDTVNCINSIKKTTTDPYKIYLIDNASTADCTNKISEKYINDKNVQLILSQTNLGYSGGNNLGILAAKKDGVEYYLIVNSDVTFDNNVVRILKDKIKNDIKVAAPQIIKTDETNGQWLIHTYDFKFGVMDRMPFHLIAKKFNICNIHIQAGKDEMIFQGMSSGACFMTTAEVFTNGVLFDDNVFLYSEERILSIVMKERAYKSIYAPEAVVHHFEGKSTGRVNAFADYHRYASDYYCLVRYGNLNWIQRKVIRFLRLINFKIKSIINKEYIEKYRKLKEKYDQIEEGNYKISF